MSYNEHENATTNTAYSFTLSNQNSLTLQDVPGTSFAIEFLSVIVSGLIETEAAVLMRFQLCHADLIPGVPCRV
jgi:hypothetical protein